MSAKKSNPHSYWKYAFTIPVIFTLLVLINKPDISVAQILDQIPITFNENEEAQVYNDQIEKESLEIQTEGIVIENANAAIDEMGLEGCPALLKAIKEEDIAEVKELLKTIDANCVDKNAGYEEIKYKDYIMHKQRPQTPLVAAAQIGHVEIAKILLEAGADPFLDTPNMHYPMFYARKSGNKELIQLLKKYEAQ